MWISTFLGSNVDTTSRDGWNGNGWILLTDVMMQKVEPPRNLAFHVFFFTGKGRYQPFFFSRFHVWGGTTVPLMFESFSPEKMVFGR